VEEVAPPLPDPPVGDAIVPPLPEVAPVRDAPVDYVAPPLPDPPVGDAVAVPVEEVAPVRDAPVDEVAPRPDLGEAVVAPLPDAPVNEVAPPLPDPPVVDPAVAPMPDPLPALPAMDVDGPILQIACSAEMADGTVVGFQKHDFVVFRVVKEEGLVVRGYRRCVVPTGKFTSRPVL
jgi:hypothetical protein